MANATSSELMARVRDGDVGQLRPIFDRYHGRLFGFFYRLTGNRETSDDLVQDVFFRILKYRHRYRESGDFTVWIYRIARNAWLDDRRAASREPVSDRPDAVPASPDPTPFQNVEQRQEISLLRRALEKLPTDKRELLILSRFQGLKSRQIAEMLDCPLSTVKVRVHRAIKELRQRFLELSKERV